MSGIRTNNHTTSQPLHHEQILQALNLIHDPRSDNDLRQQATEYLQNLREDSRAPEQGFLLASANDQSPVVRHFGLSLIDHAIRYKWADYSREQNAALRNWILELANTNLEREPPYITNKLAELWVECAKRSWAVEWMDMDELLVRLWESTIAQKVLVLNILTTISDEVFATEDTVAALRGSDLNRACVEIFVPAAVLAQQFPNRESSVNVRYGSEGWLSRMSDTLYECTKDTDSARSNEALALKVLSAYRSIMVWVVPKALISTATIQRVCASLAVPNMPVQLVSRSFAAIAGCDVAEILRKAVLDTLYNLYNRTRFSDDDFREIVGPMFRPEMVTLLKELFQWLVIDPQDIDDNRYLILKRLSETIFNLGRLLSDRHSALAQDSDIGGFVDLLRSVMKSDSLQVSIPALHLWVKFLNSEQISQSLSVQSAIADLLETCSQRLIRYEALPQDTNHPSIQFLREDIETIPERHAFLGNYSRFCNQVVERIVEKQPIDALYHILGQADQVLDHLYDNEPPFNPSTYTKYSIPWLKLDAQFTVIEAALKGCLNWLTHAENETVKHQRDVMTSNLQVWCDRLLGLTFEDPRIKERVIQLAVGFAVGPLKKDPQFAVRVFDYVLETKCPIFSECIAYNDACKDFQVFATHQLQRLAMRFADHLISIFDAAEPKILAVSHDTSSDEQTKARYTSVLFVIMHRALNVDIRAREDRLEQYLQPVIDQWQDERLRLALSSPDAFNRLLGLDAAQQYLVSRHAENVQDWASCSLDDEGKMLQARMQTNADSLPLRATKHIMASSVEKLEPTTQAFDIACRLWQKYMPIILPSLLQFISRSNALYDPENWTGMTPDQKPIVRRIFTDRFWQHGISQGSRDDFYAAVGGTKATLEGFASTIRATVRLTRETGYRLLYYMSLLGEHLYGLQDLPEPLATALFSDSFALSPHQLTVLLDTLRPVIDNCPQRYHAQFLPPIISSLFNQIDRKVGSEWAKIEQRKAASTEDSDLTAEMKDESVLRQLTMAAVMLVVGLLEPSKVSLTKETTLRPNGTIESHSRDPTRDFVLNTPEILKPLIMFCTNALSMHDTRASSLIARVLRTIIGDFAGDTPLESDVREFISTEVLKACITSLNDPYFVEMQKDFAQLIAQICILYSPRTNTPKQVIQSLPNMDGVKVDQALRRLLEVHSSSKKQRAVILELLQGLRSVAIHEQGKLTKPDPNKLRSVMQQKYMTADMEGMEIKDRDREEEIDIGGVAEMFK
ncbi:uncharacterized protein KY384_005962 [Bacidia gigantensis]|uniref:uncharacterized protein n=1 Tax=Bacidia gigantensis TaxID=2732470 RepID=UPI001D049B79|nr:uncharacterized protein KY384_005962 [Bacidia gigantensis]KAG8529326.1 hypothetical protein KY384_005962 [Bacidia gigantensis]